METDTIPLSNVNNLKLYSYNQPINLRPSQSKQDDFNKTSHSKDEF